MDALFKHIQKVSCTSVAGHDLNQCPHRGQEVAHGWTLSSEAPDTSFSVLCYIPASSLLCPFPFWLYFQINCIYL